MKGLVATALMVGRVLQGTGFLRGNAAAPGGSPRVTLKVPFITVFMTPGLSCGDTNRKGGMRIYDGTSDDVFSKPSQSHFRGPKRP